MPNKKNYTNYSKFQGSREETEPVDEVAVEPVIEEEEVVEETVEAVEETVEETTTVGIVECKNRLNVRKLPKKDSEVVCEIPNGSKVQVDLEKSTLEWYHVVTSAGIEGFCMKNFVAVK